MFSDNKMLCEKGETLFTKRIKCYKFIQENNILEYMNMFYNKIDKPTILNIFDIENECNYALPVDIIGSDRNDYEIFFNILYDSEEQKLPLSKENRICAFTDFEYMPLLAHVRNVYSHNYYTGDETSFFVMDVLAYQNRYALEALDLLMRKFKYEKNWRINNLITEAMCDHKKINNV